MDVADRALARDEIRRRQAFHMIGRRRLAEGVEERVRRVAAAPDERRGDDAT